MGINKDEAVKKIQESESTAFEVFTENEHTTFLENYEETVIAPKVKDVYDRYDKDVKEASGEDRLQNEKSYDYVKRILGSYSTKASKVNELETTISGLNDQIKAGSNDEELKTKLEKAEKALVNVKTLHKSEKETWDQAKNELVSSHQIAKMSNILDGARLGVKFKEGMTDGTIKIVVTAVTNELLEIAEMIDGVMVFNDKEGNILRNKDTLNPFTPEEMLKSKLGDVIDEGRKIDGTGVKAPEITKDKEGKKTVNFSPSAGVKSKDNLHDDLNGKGFVQGTEEYNLAWAKYSDDYKH